jgi:hypothetical protein
MSGLASPINKTANHPVWVSVSEAASFGGLTSKTIRRAIKNDSNLRYRIVKNRYHIELGSLIYFCHKNTKLKNKLQEFGVGQYVAEWK